VSLRLLYPRGPHAITGTASVEFGFETDATGAVQQHITGTADVEFGFESDAIGTVVAAVVEQPEPVPVSGASIGAGRPRRKIQKRITGRGAVAFGSESHAIGEVLPGDELWLLGLEDEEFAA
jgi:hypothetical protein